MSNSTKQNSKQTYRYKIEESILKNLNDDYQLTVDEYYTLYTFYVTYSMVGNQSYQKRTFAYYGWSSDKLDAEKNANGENKKLEQSLKFVLDIGLKNKFIYDENEKAKKLFEQGDLENVPLQNVSDERFVILKTSGQNLYIKLFYHVRNCLAHGKFVLKLSLNNEKMIIMQDNDKSNVTARIVLKLTTLLNFIKVIAE